MGGCNSTGPQYEEYDWDELPINVQQAAIILGYDKKKWDKSIDPEITEYDWDELSDEQRTAARVLGYNEDIWDDDEE